MDTLEKAKIFSDIDFLFYKKSHYFRKNLLSDNPRKGSRVDRKHLHSIDWILSHDIIVLEVTEARAHQIGFGLYTSINKQLTKRNKQKK